MLLLRLHCSKVQYSWHRESDLALALRRSSSGFELVHFGKQSAEVGVVEVVHALLQHIRG